MSIPSSFFFALRVAILVLLAGSVFGSTGRTAHLSGRVTDQNGAVVAAASIRISSREGATVSSLTDSSGSYSIGGLQAGEYLIEVSSKGFARQVLSVSLAAGADREADFDLAAAGVDDEIVVTPNGTPQSADEASKSISVVSGEDVDRRDSIDLTTAVQELPGIRAEQLGGPGSFSKIFVRGLRVVDTSVLIDGMRVRDASDFHGSINPFLGDLLMNDFDRVEVLRGSGSSLYGSNAVGGVANLVPVEGAGKPRIDLAFEGGSLGLFRESAGVTGGAGARLAFSARATRLDVNDGVHPGEIYRNTSAGAHARYTLKPGMSLRGTFIAAHGFGRVTDSPFPIGPAGNPFGFAAGSGQVAGFVEDQVNPDSFRFATMLVGSLVFSHDVNRVYSYSVGFQSVSTSTLFSNGPDQSQIARDLGILEFPGDVFLGGGIRTLNVTNNLVLGSHNLVTAGIESEWESFTQGAGPQGISRPRTTDRQSSLAEFGQDQVSLAGGRLRLLAAIRSQGFDLKNPESVPGISGISVKRSLTADGSIAYTFQSIGAKIRAHVGNSFRAPSLSERFTIFNGMRIGNPFLRPERALSVDSGIDQALFHDTLRMSATFFYTRLQEVITSTQLFFQTNSKGALSRGAEFAAEARPRNGMILRAAYTYTNSAQLLPDPTLLSDNVLLPAAATVPSFSIPRHMFSFEAGQALKHGLEVDFDLYAAGRYDFPLFDPVFFSEVIFNFGRYAKAGFGASYTRRMGESHNATVFARVDNVLNESILEEGFRTPGRAFRAGIKYQF